MQIRPLQIGENDTEARLCAAAMASSGPWLKLGRGFDACLQGLTDGSREVHVAVDGSVPGAVAGAPGAETILGFIALNLHGAFVGYIQAICVMESERGRGVGSHLIAFAEERIFREWPNVFLCVSSFNDRAQALYERLGYERVGLFRDYIERGYDEILMRKTIAPLKEFRPAGDPSLR